MASAEPPRTVKSSPTTTTGRPSILARPITQLDGISSTSRSVRVVLGLAGDGADLVEAAAIDQAVDALAHGEPAAVVLALDLVGAAHPPRQLLARAQLVELRLPAHRALRSCLGPRFHYSGIASSVSIFWLSSTTIRSRNCRVRPGNVDAVEIAAGREQAGVAAMHDAHGEEIGARLRDPVLDPVDARRADDMAVAVRLEHPARGAVPSPGRPACRARRNK